MRRLMEEWKIDTAVGADNYSITNTTGPYFNMEQFNEAHFTLSVGALAATKKAKIEIYQAKDAAGTDAEIVKDVAGDNIVAEVTANEKVQSVTIALAATGALDTVTINGVTYTRDTKSVANKKFTTAADLKECIDEHQPELKATVATTNVTVEYADTGMGTVTVSREDVGGTITLSTNSAIVLASMMREYMKSNDGFTHLAAKITTDGVSKMAVQLYRGNTARYAPIQASGASVMVK